MFRCSRASRSRPSRASQCARSHWRKCGQNAARPWKSGLSAADSANLPLFEQRRPGRIRREVRRSESAARCGRSGRSRTECGPPEPAASRKNISTRPFGAQVGPSCWKPVDRMRSPEPSVLHDADLELAAGLLGEGDEIAARRPHRRRIGAVAERDAVLAGAVGAHDVDLRAAAAVGGEHDLAAVGRIGGRGVDGGRNWSAASSCGCAGPSRRCWNCRRRAAGS